MKKGLRNVSQVEFLTIRPKRHTKRVGSVAAGRRRRRRERRRRRRRRRKKERERETRNGQLLPHLIPKIRQGAILHLLHQSNSLLVRVLALLSHLGGRGAGSGAGSDIDPPAAGHDPSDHLSPPSRRRPPQRGLVLRIAVVHLDPRVSQQQQRGPCCPRVARHRQP